METHKNMNAQMASSTSSLQPFAPDPDATYPIDIAAHLAQMPRHVVLICCKYRLVAPRVDPAYGGYSFDIGAIRTLQHIQYLKADCGINFTGIQIILQLMDEVERLRASQRAYQER